MKRMDNYEVRLRFKLRPGAAGLLGDKKRCDLGVDATCLLCDGGEK